MSNRNQFRRPDKNRQGRERVGLKRASRLLGIRKKTLLTWARAGLVPSINLGRRGFRFFRGELRQAIQADLARASNRSEVA